MVRPNGRLLRCGQRSICVKRGVDLVAAGKQIVQPYCNGTSNAGRRPRTATHIRVAEMTPSHHHRPHLRTMKRQKQTTSEKATDVKSAHKNGRAKRRKVTHDNEAAACTVCNESITQSQQLQHSACTTRTGFISIKSTGQAFTLQRDDEDNKVPCPNCEERQYNMDVLKKHIRLCVKTGPREPQTAAASGSITETAKIVVAESTQASVLNQPTTTKAAKTKVTSQDEEITSEFITRDSNTLATLNSGPSQPSLDVLAPEARNVTADHTIATDTVQPPLLREYGLAINTAHRVLICLGCKGIIKPNSVRPHYVNYHKDVHMKKDFQQRFDQEIQPHYPGLTYNPCRPLEPVEPVYGLAPAIADYIKCTTCQHHYQDKDSFTSHACLGRIASTTRSYVQRFAKNNNSPWFAVRVITQTESAVNPWTLYSQHTAVDDQPSNIPAQEANYRVLHQFLYKEKWIERVQGHNHEHLIPLAAYSIHDNLYGTLHKHLTMLFASLQNTTQSYYLRRLISTRPAQEHDTIVIRHHQSVNSETHIAYARIVAAAIALIHRITTNPTSPYTFQVSSDIAAACDALVTSLTPPPRNDEMAALEHELEPTEVYGNDSDDDFDIIDVQDEPVTDEERLGGKCALKTTMSYGD
ncbi:hypothetical protein P691DRAFT_783118 [Macrolepiota fuliginosa MF-IS2]|uniref:C2H2-type domain-containing protein n=1 Tax=Macrolepiota fuliginosa MF-IS2 TaxID=1400762 RepID=A0A9P5WZJ1_9AGAR|nr:hypothetical protein P691DRAFT_783118 [Macrolepiota fuliginosa MF-IS2]